MSPIFRPGQEFASIFIFNMVVSGKQNSHSTRAVDVQRFRSFLNQTEWPEQDSSFWRVGERLVFISKSTFDQKNALQSSPPQTTDGERN